MTIQLDSNTQATNAQIEPRWLTVRWSDGTESRYHHLWLRDNSPELLHASTHHRVVETSTIPDDLQPSAVTLTPAGDVRVSWPDDHVSTFGATWLREHDYSNGVRHRQRALTLWDASMAAEIPHCSYPELVADAGVRRRFLEGFVAYGLGIMHDLPGVPGTVLEVGAELGEVRTTSWGKVFDVVSMADANSVAYTNLPLVTHTDEGYRDPAPTIQLQHFLRSDTTGGESTLVDGFRIAEDLRRDHPDAFELLASTPLRFHFADATAEHEAYESVIDLHGTGELRAIRFSNHSVSSFLLPFDVMEAYYEAYRLFGRMRESSTYQLRIPMGTGDLYMVDNRRVMHGRSGFSSTGARHLQSCYIERDELVSRLTVLQRSS